MKKNFGLILAIALGLSALLLSISFQAGWVKARPPLQENREGAPDFISYQGQIWDGNVPYDGDGYFMFAIINEGEDYIWSNDGSRPPETSIALPVTNGLFSVNLGDTTIPGMDDRLSSVHFDERITFLRVWFSPDDSTWTQMPDQQIAAVPYAYQAYHSIYADQATNADTLDTKHAAAFQLRVTESCPTGQSIREINSDGSVLCEVDDSMTYTNGTGILLVGNTFSADPDYLQRRVSTSCVEGSAIKTINSDGSVECETIEQFPRFSLTTVDSDDDVGTNTSITIGTDGLGLISYYDTTHGDLKVAHCKDINCTQATNYTLDSTNNVGWHTSITIGSDGLGLISYHENTLHDLKVAHCDNVICSSATISTLDSVDAVGMYSSITIGTDDLGLISYFDDTYKNLKIAHCEDILCSSATISTLDIAGDVGFLTSIAIGTDGLGLISYQDGTYYDLKVAHCSDVVCSSATITTLDSAGVVGYATSLKIGSDGLGLIAYVDNPNDDLKIAHCDNLLCTSATITTLDTIEVVGNYTSLAIGNDGLGLVSFKDLSNLDLKIAHCNNDLCTDATFYTLDYLGEVGGHNALVIGNDGMGLISYFDDTNNDLKVAHCSNEFCMPINWEH